MISTISASKNRDKALPQQVEMERAKRAHRIGGKKAGGGPAGGGAKGRKFVQGQGQSDHHLLGRRQLQRRIVALDAVDVPLQAGQEHHVAVAVGGDMALVDVDELLDLGLGARDPAGRGEVASLRTAPAASIPARSGWPAPRIAARPTTPTM